MTTIATTTTTTSTTSTLCFSLSTGLCKICCFQTEHKTTEDVNPLVNGGKFPRDGQDRRSQVDRDPVGSYGSTVPDQRTLAMFETG